MAKTQEKAFNFALGDALRDKHPRWPDRIGVEQTGVFTQSAGLCPDIIVRHPGGVPVAVETEFAPANTVEDDAVDRLGMALKQDGCDIEQAIAVRIPVLLAKSTQDKLHCLIADMNFEYCVFSGDGADNATRWPESGWIKGGINDLAACIEYAALSQDRIAKGMQVLEDGIGQAATILREASADAPDTLKAIADELHQDDGQQTSRMAMAILANALTFHTAISGAHKIETLDQIRTKDGRLPKRKVLDVWDYILKEINYWPIFRIASDILLPIRNGTAQQILDRLARVASELDALGATSQHDLCGRMFQRLISDRKFLATFYTLPSSAALLAELAVSRLDVDWSDGEAVASLRIADFACGTGALLNAAYAAVTGRYRREDGDDREVHSRMMESALVGADIMPAASHLTATVLSSTHPSVPFRNTSIITMPYGEQSVKDGRPVIALGALDLIGTGKAPSLFETGQERVRGLEDSDGEQMDFPHSSFDLVIMNPPFTRPTNHEIADVPVPSFAGFATSKDEQKAMSATLKNARTKETVGNGNAGLASNFIDIAHAKVKPGGVLALVIPASFAQGDSWEDARALLERHYLDVSVVSIATVGQTDRAFSADTGMAEVLVVGTRRTEYREPDRPAAFINLNGRPDTILEAVTIAKAAQRLPTDLFSAPILIGDSENVGCGMRGELSNAGYAGVREPGVARAAAGLWHGELRFPRRVEPVKVPVTTLADLGDRGLMHRDLNGKGIGKDGLPRGPFDNVPTDGGADTWPILWGHDAERETRMVVEPDQKGRVRSGCDERAVEAWGKTASHLHYSLDFRINSQPLSACITDERTIGGRAWPNFLCTDARWEIPIVIWANTTLGLLAFWWAGTLQQTGRAILTIKKLPTLAALDVRQLSVEQINLAHDIFELFKDEELLPANEAWRDETRQDLDRTVLIDLLELPEDIMEPLALLRRQWCAEPSVHGGKKTAPEGWA